jgi:hypothetical protein
MEQVQEKQVDEELVTARSVVRSRKDRFWPLTPGSKRDCRRFFAHTVKTAAGCLLWQGAKRGEYGQVRVYKECGTGTFSAHRTAYCIAYGECPADMVVRNKCDNPLCINPKHLELGTHADNVADRVARGRSGKTRTLKPKPTA